MSEKPYSKVGKTYYPKPQSLQISDDEVKGRLWRVWREGERIYFEYDAGHFATEMKIVEVTKVDFELVKAGTLTDKDLIRKYR